MTPVVARPPVAGGRRPRPARLDVRLRATRWPGTGTARPAAARPRLDAPLLGPGRPAPRPGCRSSRWTSAGTATATVRTARTTRDASSRDALTALDALGLSRVVVVGHSWGAWTALRLAATAPERVLAVVAIDGGCRPAADLGPTGRAARRRLEPPRTAAAAGRSCASWCAPARWRPGGTTRSRRPCCRSSASATTGWPAPGCRSRRTCRSSTTCSTPTRLRCWRRSAARPGWCPASRSAPTPRPRGRARRGRGPAGRAPGAALGRGAARRPAAVAGAGRRARARRRRGGLGRARPGKGTAREHPAAPPARGPGAAAPARALAAFEGWNDAGEAASGAVDHLLEAWDGSGVAAIDPDDYYDFQVNRPDGLARRRPHPPHHLADDAGSRSAGCPTPTATSSCCAGSSRTCAGAASATSCSRSSRRSASSWS